MVDPALDVIAAHDIAVEAHHALLHGVPRLIDATVHSSPAGTAGRDQHERLAHHHDDLQRWAGRTAQASGVVDADPNSFGEPNEQAAAAVLLPEGGWCREPGGTMPQPGQGLDSTGKPGKTGTNLLGPIPPTTFAARSQGQSVQPAFPAVTGTPAEPIWAADKALYNYNCQHWEAAGDTPADLAAAVDGLGELADTFVGACSQAFGEIRRRLDDGRLTDVNEGTFTAATSEVMECLGVGDGYSARLSSAFHTARRAMTGGRAGLLDPPNPDLADEVSRLSRRMHGKSLAFLRAELGQELHLQRLRSKSRQPDYRRADAPSRLIQVTHAKGVAVYHSPGMELSPDPADN